MSHPMGGVRGRHMEGMEVRGSLEPLEGSMRVPYRADPVMNLVACILITLTLDTLSHL